MRAIFLAAIFIFSAYASEIISVVAVVNGEPITSYEIEKTSQEEKISKKQALELLIDLRLQDAHIKELGLAVDDFEVADRVAQIARRNNLDPKDFEEVLINRGMDFEQYKKDVKKTLLNEKLAQTILRDEIFPVSEGEIEQLYKKEGERFSIPKEIVVFQYSSKNERELRKVMNSPMIRSSEVSVSEQTLKTDTLNPRLLALLIETEEGHFTPLFPVNDALVALLVREKKGRVKLPLDQVRDAIAAELRSERESRGVANYFSKARAKAEINILRDVR